MRIDSNKLQIALANSVMSLMDVSKKSDVSYSALLKMKNGTTKPHPSTVGKVAKALDIPVNELLED